MVSDEELKKLIEFAPLVSCGTYVECKDCPYHDEGEEKCVYGEAKRDLLADALRELQERREKDKARKPIFKTSVSIVHCDKADGTAETRRTLQEYWHCPNCDGYVGGRVTVHGHVHDRDKKKFCEKCGQKIDWSEE